MKQQEAINHKRVWEVDCIRGILIFLMLFTHLYLCVSAFVVDGLYTRVDAMAYLNATDPLHFFFPLDSQGTPQISPLFYTLVSGGMALFFVVSGISCAFSRNNYRRAAIIFCFAYLVTLAFIVYSRVSGRHVIFRFGALHAYAFSIAAYEGMRRLMAKRRAWWALAIGIPVIVAGYWLMHHPVSIDGPWLVPFGVRQAGNEIEREYYPLLPYMGWLFLGGFLGQTVYRAKKSRIPKLEKAWSRPFQWLGRYSGWVYGVQFIAFPLIFCLIGVLWGLF